MFFLVQTCSERGELHGVIFARNIIHLWGQVLLGVVVFVSTRRILCWFSAYGFVKDAVALQSGMRFFLDGFGI